MARRKRQALSAIANLASENSAKRRKTSTESPNSEGIPSEKENQSVRPLKHIRE